MTRVIEVKNVCKTYGTTKAIDKVSLQVERGNIYGLIGLNGAGKTTLIRMLLGLIQPTAGACYLNGKKVTRRHYTLWKEVGYLADTSDAYPELTVLENLTLQRKLRRISDPNAVKRVLHLLDLTKYTDTLVSHLSLGNQQRLKIAKALLHRPKILLLDEPTNGLDPAGIVGVRRLLTRLAEEEKVTILLSSHRLDELAKLITTVGILHHGKLMTQITIDELYETLEKKLILDSTNRPLLENILKKHDYTFSRNKNNAFILSDQKAVNERAKIAKQLIEENVPLTTLFVEEETVEQYFLRQIT